MSKLARCKALLLAVSITAESVRLLHVGTKRRYPGPLRVVVVVFSIFFLIFPFHVLRPMLICDIPRLDFYLFRVDMIALSTHIFPFFPLFETLVYSLSLTIFNTVLYNLILYSYSYLLVILYIHSYCYDPILIVIDRSLIGTPCV